MKIHNKIKAKEKHQILTAWKSVPIATNSCEVNNHAALATLGFAWTLDEHLSLATLK